MAANFWDNFTKFSSNIFNLTKSSCLLWFGAYLKLHFYRNVCFSLTVTLSFSLMGLLQKQLSQLVWLLIPWVSQRYRRISGWSMPLDCFSLTFVSSSLSPLCNSPNCPYSRSGSQTSPSVCLRVTKHLLSAQTLQLPLSSSESSPGHQ